MSNSLEKYTFERFYNNKVLKIVLLILAVASALITIYAAFFPEKQHNLQYQMTDYVSNEKKEIVSEKRISEITVYEIIESINTSVPLMKEEMEKKYNGIRVKWTGYLRTAEMNGDNKVRINMNVEKNSIIGNSIWFTENINKIPEIRTLPKDSKIIVLGDIISASGDGISVTLKPIEIEIIRNN
jgi:hypothetical protein